MINVDFHAHSTLQPFSESIRLNKERDPLKSSIWYYNPPSLFKKWMSKITGISSSSQSNFTSAAKGKVTVIGVALYPPEISFFQQKLPNVFDNGLEQILKRYGEDRIHEIESGTYSYFKELKEQYQFMLSFHNQKSPNEEYTSKIAKTYNDIEEVLNDDSSTIIAFFSIEGAHTLNCGYPDFWESDLSERQQEKILQKVEMIKNWEYPIVYLTFCHHFYNQLCGHCKSLPENYAKYLDQSYGLDFPFTDFGEKVLRKLLDNTNGKRILIDIKHMSIAGRQIYFELVEDLREKQKDQIPVIYSHGGVNGRKDYGVLPEESSNLKLNTSDVCLFDSEIIAIAKSRGIIGLNMDQRMMSSSAHLKQTYKRALGRPKRKRKHLWAGIIWNNIRHIAETLNKEGLIPWDYICLGSDFDGAVNPIHFFAHEKEIPSFYKYLKIHIEEYLQSTECRLLLKHQISADEIIEKLMYKNALHFLMQNLHQSSATKNIVVSAT